MLDSAEPVAAVAVYAAGYVGVIRYIGEPGHPRCVTRQELDDASGYGIGLALLHARGDGEDWRGGYPAGHAAATIARSHASSVGFPDGRPIYFSVTGVVGADQLGTAREYLTGVADVLTSEFTGVYGCRDVVTVARGAGVANYFWQQGNGANAHTDVNLNQSTDTVIVGGAHCRVSTVHMGDDWGQHLPAGRVRAPLLVDAFVAATEHLPDEAVLKLAIAYASELARRRQAR